LLREVGVTGIERMALAAFRHPGQWVRSVLYRIESILRASTPPNIRQAIVE
jgi:hypothetical protein